jgi:hypothetical protein
MAETATDQRRYPGAGGLVLTVAVFALFLFSARTFADSDTLWHIAAGNWILDHRAVPHTDPFAFTTAGLDWTPHEWLAEVAFALAWRAGGFTFVVLLVGAAAAGAFWMMARLLERWVAPLPAYVLLLLTLLCFAPAMLARPHVLALPVMVAWTGALVAAREREGAPSLWLTPLMCLWANLHGGFLAGLVLAAALAGEAVLGAPAGQRARVLRGWAVFGLLSLLAATLTPHGIAGLLFPVRMMALDSKRRIDEWAAPNFQSFEPMEIILLGALGLGLLRGVRLPPVRVLIFLGLVHSALSHTRFQLQLAVVGFLVLAPSLGPYLWPAHWPVRRAGNRRAEAGVLVALLLALALARMAEPARWPDGPNAPWRALAQLPPALRTQPVLNEYHLGGVLIFSGIRPFIDSRADLYRDAFLAEYVDIVNARPERVRAALARWGIAWTFLEPGAPLVAWFDAQPDWRRVYADGFAVIHAKRDALPGG